VNLVYEKESGGPTVTFSEAAISTMTRHRQTDAKSKEAGGQLFAKFEGNNTVVIGATEPKTLDSRARCRFIPNRWLQQMEIKSLHREGKHFVGDWHTHPEPIPSPSGEDIKSMVECFRKSRHELKAFLMVIVGTAKLPEGLFVCLVDGNGVTKLAISCHHAD